MVFLHDHPSSFENKSGCAWREELKEGAAVKLRFFILTEDLLTLTETQANDDVPIQSNLIVSLNRSNEGYN